VRFGLRGALALVVVLVSLLLSRGLAGASPGDVPANVALDEPQEPLVPSVVPVRRHDVYDLKVRLKELGFYSGPLDDSYDLSCVDAVRRFQKTYWLDANGTVEFSTWRALAHGVARPERAATGPPPEGGLSIEIDTQKVTLTLLVDGKPWRAYPVAAGKWETMTPVGEWRIVDKGYRIGGPFGSRWMALDVPWGGYGIHGTNMPWTIGGYFSVGCVRMFNEDVEEVFDLVPYGTLVVVKGYRPEVDFTKPIGPGSRTPEVVALQQALRRNGFDAGRCDGVYGPLTAAKVGEAASVYGLSMGPNLIRDLVRVLGVK
jgi:peptidoglycan hydrolase-like protein with peptidoglycan-binding domain